MNYYNEFDPKAAEWQRQLIRDILIPEGFVDERSIREVKPDELREFTQCHFFSGIAGWPLALRLAGWPESLPVWTGSCPCQPFSCIGKGDGEKDDRHLWPEFRRLIAECKPPVVFGEQVASSDGRDWLAGVRSDLETLGYEVGCADLCAASVGSPHMRQRLFWVGYADSRRWSAWKLSRGREEVVARASESDGSSGRMVNTVQPGLERLPWDGDHRDQSGRFIPSAIGSIASAGSTGFWDQFDIAHCEAGKTRRIEPGTFPLAHGVSGRVGLLRGYGNAIVPQVAAKFIRCFMDFLNLKGEI